MSLKKKSLIIAVDFDGTCVTHDFPRVGKDIGAASVLRDIVAAGHKLILWTMRSDGRDCPTARNGQVMENTNPLTDAVNWFDENGIKLFGIQRNPDQDTWTSSPKAYAHLYIDDAALGCPLKEDSKISDRPFVDWDEVREFFFK